jgi:hypothetical protein
MTVGVEVRRVGDGRFDVAVRERGSETRHAVTMDAATFARLAGDSGTTPEAFISAVFAFLLEREPKDSIFARFDVTAISRYFPEFEREILHYIGK